jgi:anti-sigma factor RsiW
VSLPSLPVQHLTDEAVAAFADGALGVSARHRAARHLAECAECSNAVAVQREAVWALRSAVAPSLPFGLLDRLRAVPSTTPLNQHPLALDPDGSAVFPAFGTSPIEPDAPAAPPPSHAPMSVDRRHRSYGLLTAAAAVVALGTAGVAVASASGRGVPAAPGAPAQVSPAVFNPNAGFYAPALGATLVTPR